MGTEKVKVNVDKARESYSSSAESMSPEQSKDDRRKKSCRTKTIQTSPKHEIQEEVKILKDHSQQLRDQSMKDRKEIESLRKELEKLNLVVKEKDQELVKK